MKASARGVRSEANTGYLVIYVILLQVKAISILCVGVLRTYLKSKDTVLVQPSAVYMSLTLNKILNINSNSEIFSSFALIGNRVEKQAASLEAMAENNEKTQNRGGVLLPHIY